MKSPFVFLLTMLAMAACQQEVATSSFLQLYVRYEADTETTLAQASLFDLTGSGQRTVTTPEGGMAFLGSNMEKKELPEGLIRYHYTHKGVLPATLPVSWNSKNGQKTTLEVGALVLEKFQFQAEGESIRISFEGPAIGAGETLTLLFTDADRRMINKEVSGPLTTNEVVLPKSDLHGLANGKGQLALVRTAHFTKKQQEVEADITFSYYSKSLEVVW